MANAVIEKLNGKLLSPIVSEPSGKDGYAFRGELGLKFPQIQAGEARPPDIKADQVILTIEGEKITFLALNLDSFAHLDNVLEVLSPFLVPEGKYFIFAGNIDFSKKYKVERDGFTFFALPLDEATVYNEVLELLSLDRGDLKKMTSLGKVEAIVKAAKKGKVSGTFPVIPFETAVSELGPIKVAEYRPV